MSALKEKLAARRAAKSERKQRAAAKTAPQRANRQALSNYHRRQNLLKMQRGEALPLDARLTAVIRDYCRLDDLAARHDNACISHFERLARQTMLYGGIYDDPRPRQAARAAETALKISHDARRRPTAERKTILRPLAELIEWAHAYRETVPAATADLCELYCDAAQTLMYAKQYASLPAWHQDALYRVIKGQSLRSIAQEIKANGYTITETELRRIILYAAGLAHQTVQAAYDLPEPSGIPVLRCDTWRALAEPEMMAVVIDRAGVIVNDFERDTGITILNYKEFTELCLEAKRQECETQAA